MNQLTSRVKTSQGPTKSFAEIVIILIVEVLNWAEVSVI